MAIIDGDPTNKRRERTAAMALAVSVALGMSACSNETGPTFPDETNDIPAASAETTATPETTDAGTMPTDNFSPTPTAEESPSTQETDSVNPEWPINAESFEKVRQELTDMSIEDIDGLSLEERAKRISSAFMKHSNDGSSILYLESKDSDCELSYGYGIPLDNPLADVVTADSDPMQVFCQTFGIENVIFSSTEDGSNFSDAGTPLDKIGAEKLARLVYGPGAAIDEYTNEVLQNILGNIEASDQIDHVGYETVAQTARVVNSGDMNGHEFLDIEINDIDFGEQRQRWVGVELTTPLVRETKLSSIRLGGEEGDSTGDMYMVRNNDGTARVIASGEYPFEELEGNVTDVTSASAQDASTVKVWVNYGSPNNYVQLSNSK